MTCVDALLVATCLLSAAPTSATLKGVVHDADGKPIAGVRVDIATAAPRVGQGMFCPSCYLDCKKWTRTDNEGKFEIAALDPTLKFRILVTLAGKVAQLTSLVDPDVDFLNVTLKDLPTDLPAERIIRGKIVDDLGLAIEGALIEPEGAKTLDRRWWGQVRGVQPSASDSEGRFVIPLPEGFQGLDVEVTADGHAGASVALLTAGEQEHRITVPTGTRVRGKIVHGGKPVVGATVAVVQTERAMDHHFIKAVTDTSDRNGSFTFSYLPANEEYVIYSIVGEGTQNYVMTTKRFKAKGNHQERDLGSLETIPAMRLAGRMEAPEGTKLPRGIKLSLGREPAWDLISVPVDSEGNFAIDGLPPETYQVRLVAKKTSIDGTRLPFQMLGENQFGIRLRQSVEDLVIPIEVQN